MLRQGTLSNLVGFMLKESAQVATHTKGTGASYLVNSAALAIGSTVIPADTGSGTIVAGDVVTFAGDTNKYVVVSALSGGSFTIGAPGLRTAVADNSAITVGNNYAPNIALHKSAIELVIRPPALPPAEAAVDVLDVTDPLTGVTIQLALYKPVIRRRCSKPAPSTPRRCGRPIWSPLFLANGTGAGGMEAPGPTPSGESALSETTNLYVFSVGQSAADAPELSGSSRKGKRRA
jgi:hypothetical protein